MATFNPILTIGHSNHPLLRFLDLLGRAKVTAVADVRSAPVSRFAPHFNKVRLAESLREKGISYVFLGQDLGGRPEQSVLFTDGVADYEKMATVPAFRSGIERLIAGAQSHRIAALCAEADPLDCHRCLLVGRALTEAGADVGHILSSGEIISHENAEDRLVELAGFTAGGLLPASRVERLDEAYRLRARKVAYAMRKSSVNARGATARRD